MSYVGKQGCRSLQEQGSEELASYIYHIFQGPCGRCTFEEALKTTDAAPPPKVTPPSEILAALKNIDGLEGGDLLRAYGKLTHNERTFESLMALPEDMRKPWLLSLP